MLRTNRLEPDFAIATGIHVLDAIRFLMGDPESIAVTPYPSDNSAACGYSVRLVFPNSAVAEISMMLNTGLRRESYFLSAEGRHSGGCARLGLYSPLCHQGDREWVEERIVSENPLTNDPLIDGGFLGEYKALFHALAMGAPSPCSLSDAARSMQLAEAVLSCYSGRLPPLPVA